MLIAHLIFITRITGMGLLHSLRLKPCALNVWLINSAIKIVHVRMDLHSMVHKKLIDMWLNISIILEQSVWNKHICASIHWVMILSLSLELIIYKFSNLLIILLIKLNVLQINVYPELTITPQTHLTLNFLME